MIVFDEPTELRDDRLIATNADYIDRRTKSANVTPIAIDEDFAQFITKLNRVGRPAGRQELHADRLD